MADTRASIKLGMHLSVGDGDPVLVADIDVPMTLTLVPRAPEGTDRRTTGLNVTMDHEAFRASLAQQLHTLADTLKTTQGEQTPTGGFSDLFPAQ